MMYVGGKSRLSKQISEVILADTPERGLYVEPFVGGASVLARMAPHFERSLASDAHPDLILMWQAVQRGWEPPDIVDEEYYQSLRYAAPSAVRGFVGFSCSFSGKWFGGFARDRSTGRNFAAESARGHAKYGHVFRESRVEFDCMSYEGYALGAGDVVYLDPPYAETTGYSVGQFDHEKFWDVAREWRDNGAHVYVSEFTAPDDWSPIWEKGRSVGLGGHAGYYDHTDRLFV